MIFKNNNVVVGAGLIAKSFGEVDFGRPVLLLASGVSDSTETRSEAFRREVDVIERAIAEYPHLHVLYCSSCSVDSIAETPYVAHKLDIERRIRASASSFHIFRLPQVVGIVHNRTLVSHFVDSIISGRRLAIHARATRNLLDVRDAARVARLMVRLNVGVGAPQNIASSTQTPVASIVTEIARLLGRHAEIENVDAGYSQHIDITFLRGILPVDDPLFDCNYWRRVLEHYVPLMALVAAK